MKNLRLAIVLFLGLLSNAVEAQPTQINIKAPNFVRHLAERWVAEYRKTTPDVQINIIKGQAADDAHTINFVVSDEPTNKGIVSVGRYAILPLTVKSSEAERILAKRKLNTKRYKELFFVDNNFDNENNKKDIDRLHVYTGNSRQSVVYTLAKYFDKDVADLKGKKISGDDSFLNVAITKDPLGVTFNTVSNIYDLHTRQPKAGLSIVPIDTDKSAGQAFATLDELLELLESRTLDCVPVAKVGLSYDKYNPEIGKFVSWILTEGTQYLHQYGLLNLNAAELAANVKSVGRQQELAQK